MKLKLFVLTVILSACASPMKPAPVVERSPVIPREVIDPKLPSAEKVQAPQASPSADKKTVSDKKSSNPSAAEKAPVVQKPVDKKPEPPEIKKSPSPETSNPTTPSQKEAAPATNQLPQAVPLTDDEPVMSRPVTPAPASSESSATTSPSMKWTWPLNLPTAGPFTEAKKGLDFVGGAGLPVLAALSGQVSYVGNSIRGYGQMVVVRHDQGYITVYANGSKVLVKEGMTVTGGQKIAETGRAEGSDIALHFELRRQGKPIDPLTLFPARP